MNNNVIKKVNVYPKRPIFLGHKQIVRDELGIELAVGDIFQCLLAMAIVEEVSESGEVVELKLSDFHGKNWTEKKKEKVVKVSPADGKGKTLYTEKKDTKPEQPKPTQPDNNNQQPEQSDNKQDNPNKDSNNNPNINKK